MGKYIIINYQVSVQDELRLVKKATNKSAGI
jgi:hypothetical protein